MLGTLLKDPSAKLDYTIDFGGWLESDETISTATWSRSPVGITISGGSYAPSISSDGKSCTVWLESGTAGTEYTITVQVTTNNSPARIDERSFKVQVENR
ncbi:MAG TPA: hypothetical protein VFZ53_10365 [Polyangiaceae bacterium]